MRIRILLQTVFSILLMRMGSIPFTAEQPLDQDSVALLLLGGATAEKKTQLILKRGIDFQPTPELERQFRGLGGDQQLLSALRSLRPKATSWGDPADNAAPSRRSTTPGNSSPILPTDVEASEEALLGVLRTKARSIGGLP